jgi:predicted Zn-dependent protease
VAKSNAKPVPEPAESHAAKAPSTEAAVAQAAPTPAPVSAPTPAPVAKSAAPAPAAADSSAEAGDGKLMAAARARLNAHDVDGAETLAREALAQDRDDHHAMEVLAQALIDQHRGAEALKYAQLIVKKRPKRAAYRVIEGDAKSLLGDQAGAQSAWEQALTLEPNNKSIQHRLGI